MHGIENGMGVITEAGVVGIIRDVSSNYATVMSLLNKNTIISTRFIKSNHFGDLIWDGKSHQFAQLKSVEKYVPVNVETAWLPIISPIFFQKEYHLELLIDLKETKIKTFIPRLKLH